MHFILELSTLTTASVQEDEDTYHVIRMILCQPRTEHFDTVAIK